MSRVGMFATNALPLILLACGGGHESEPLDSGVRIDKPEFTLDAELARDLAPYEALPVVVSRVTASPVQPSRFVSEAPAGQLVPDWIIAGPERLLDVPVEHPEHGALRSVRERFVLTPTREDLGSLPDLVLGDQRFPGPEIELSAAVPIDPRVERPGAMPETVPQSSGFFSWWALGGLALLLLVASSTWVLIKRGRRDRRRPVQRAGDRIREAEHPAVIHAAIREFLDEEYGLHTRGSTTAEVLQTLSDDERFADREVERLRETLETCDLASFAAKDLGAERFAELVESASAFCTAVTEGGAR